MSFMSLSEMRLVISMDGEFSIHDCHLHELDGAAAFFTLQLHKMSFLGLEGAGFLDLSVLQISRKSRITFISIQCMPLLPPLKISLYHTLGEEGTVSGTG